VTLHIKGFDDELHQAAKEAAVKRRESLKDLVTRAVEREVERCAEEDAR
jgi:hypothetical protein